MNVASEKIKLYRKAIAGYALAAAAVAIFFLGNHAIEAYKARTIASQEWPTVDGMVIESRAEKRVSTDSDGDKHNYYVAAITYEYVIDDTRYTSNQLGWKDNGQRSSMVEVQELANSYPQGKVIVVHYDPDKPGFALLNTTLPELPNEAGIGYFILSGAILAIATALIYAHSDMLLKVPAWAIVITSMVIFGGGILLTALLNLHFFVLIGFGLVFAFAYAIVHGHQ